MSLPGKEQVMIYQLIFTCGEPGCDEDAAPIYEALPEETEEQLRQRDPLLSNVLCNANHSRSYRASSAREIRLVPDITPLLRP
jgi:hypothetical protein